MPTTSKATPRHRPAAQRRKPAAPRRRTPAYKQRSLRPLIIIGSILFVVILALVISISYCFKSFRGADAWVYIPSDATEASVADSLRSSLGADFAAHTLRLWKLQGGSPATSHGAYLITPGSSALSVSRTIAKGRQTPVHITWNEARHISRIASRISRTIEADSLAVACAIENVLNEHSIPPALHIGALLPDTYEVYWSATPESIVEKLYEHYLEFWTPERTQTAKKLGVTPAQMAIIASIAEEETADADERGIVGRLYINRLNINMPLQADPTVRYALDDFSIRRVTNAHTRFQSPYNTYVNRGLPPGPIRNPSAATILSILESKPHSFLYMCARPDFSGLHNFASDYDTHRANAARYQAELNRRGIK